MLDVRALLVTEGPTDELLAPHLAALCLGAGADEASCRCPDLAALAQPPGRAVGPKVATALRLHPDTNLLFVHRDADAAGPEAREDEIARALGTLGDVPPHVAVVPVRALEAWLLLDDAEIRRASGDPASRHDLGLPTARRVESVADPKRRLAEVIELAQQDLGRRHRASFASVRRRLVERLDLSGPIRHLPAFARLVRDVDTAVARLPRRR